MNATYPKVYKPSGIDKLISGFLCFILGGAFIQYLIQTPHNYTSTESIIVYIAVLSCFYLVTIYSFGYSVTLYENAIEVTTILSTNKIYSSEIVSYSTYFGKYGKGLILVSKDSPFNNSHSYGKKQKSLKIHFSFDWDDDFVRWMANLPCELNPTISDEKKLDL